jgi:2-C-methyl-D-erythritol 4-phosphate cytidylyltransferase
MVHMRPLLPQELIKALLAALKHDKCQYPIIPVSECTGTLSSPDCSRQISSWGETTPSPDLFDFLSED